MKIIFHGATREVGRSCIEIESHGSKILMDAGIKVHEHGIEHPTNIENMEAVQAVFISHGHLDHIGSLPLFDHRGMKCPIFCTHITRGIAKILLEDAMHVQLLKHQHPAYSNFDINDALGRMRLINYRKPYSYNQIHFEFFDAGHIPGSASILLRMEGKRILYSGDFNTRKTHLLEGADTGFKNIDVLITEATYGDEDHPSRLQEEKQFISSINKILNLGGSVLIPVFSLGRAQEIAIMLSKYSFDVPIYLDGMARKITALCIGSSKLNSSGQLKNAMSRIKMIKNREHRESVMYQKAIFLSTAGMLDGGPVLEYLKHMWHNPKNGILMTGFQAEGTNGRMLLENERAYVDGMQIHWDGMIRKYDFSAHSGMKELQRLIQKVKPKVLMINHGDEPAILALEKFAKAILPKVYSPTLGQVIEI